MSSLAVVYDSKTGNVARFIKRLPEDISVYRATEIETIDQPFVMVTYTHGRGITPDSTQSFLERNHKHLKGVAASGNKNWGLNYAKAADNISQQFNVPIIMKFELSGSKRNVDQFIHFVKGEEQ